MLMGRRWAEGLDVASWLVRGSQSSNWLRPDRLAVIESYIADLGVLGEVGSALVVRVLRGRQAGSGGFGRCTAAHAVTGAD